MSSDKIECAYCNIKILRRNFDRHWESKTHKKNELIYQRKFKKLREWAWANLIHNYGHLSKEKIEEIKKQFKTSNDKLELFNEEKLTDIAERLSIRQIDLNREEIIKQIRKVIKKPNRLGLRDTEYIEKLATKYNIPIKPRKELINDIYEYLKNKPISNENNINIYDKSSSKGSFREYALTNSNDEFIDIPEYLEIHRLEIMRLIVDMLKANKNIKGQLALHCEYERKLPDGQVQNTPMFYSLRSTEIFNIKDFIDDQFKKLINREQLYQPNKGSGWTLKRCKELSLKLNKHILLNAGSYIELPKQIKCTKTCINFANKDNYCFIYSIRCAINKPKLHPERPIHYKEYINDEIFKEFEYPMSLKDIKIFEKRSFDSKYDYPTMSINVYSFDEKLKIVPLQISEVYNAKLEINLLYYTVDDNSHYILITNLSALVSSQISKNHSKKHICRRCLSNFYPAFNKTCSFKLIDNSLHLFKVQPDPLFS